MIGETRGKTRGKDMIWGDMGGREEGGKGGRYGEGGKGGRYGGGGRHGWG